MEWLFSTFPGTSPRFFGEGVPQTQYKLSLSINSTWALSLKQIKTSVLYRVRQNNLSIFKIRQNTKKTSPLTSSITAITIALKFTRFSLHNYENREIILPLPVFQWNIKIHDSMFNLPQYIWNE